MNKESFNVAFNKPNPREERYPEVWIDVRGGCAEVIHKPQGIVVIIKDWDSGAEEKYMAQEEVSE